MLDGVRGSVIRFTVAGQGEPFASLIYREFLEGFDKSRFPELTGIRLITNGTLLTPEAWDRVRNVHPHVRSITVSVDGGTKETYEKNRPGANFEVLLRNLEFISTLRDRMRINLSMVVQANNFREMGLVAGIARRFGMTSSFCRIFKNAMGDDEMRERAVWNPTHPDHAEMLRMVEDVSEKFCGMVDFPGLGRSR
jgi:MoaA/NifB/PqqE/SkfB family radical SAM enzyme